MEIREITKEDLQAVIALETICFPPEQAASGEQLQQRFRHYGNHFLLAEDDGVPVGYVGGMVREEALLTDKLYENPALHQENGAFQMVFSLVVTPERRQEGIGSQLLKAFVERARVQGRSGVSLTCLERLIPFYEHLGFHNCGVSTSSHGNVVWYDMVLLFMADRSPIGKEQ